MRFATFSFVLALSTAITLAQKPTEVLVSLDVRVFGADESAVTTLTIDDFSIYEGGQLQRIRDFESVEYPFSILLLVDRSGSMEDDWVFLEPAINRFLSKLRPQDRIAIAGFDDKPEMIMDWRKAQEGRPSDIDLRPYRRQPSTIIGEVIPAGNGRPEQRASLRSTAVQSDFYGALGWAQTQFQGVRTRRGVIVFSGGIQPLPPGKMHIVNSAEDKDFQKILRTTEQTEVPLYFLTVGTDLNPRREFPIVNVENPMQIRVRLQQLADASGGSVAYPIKPDDVAPIYEQIARELGTTYTLTFASTRTANSGSSSKIEVRVRGDNLRLRQSIHGFPIR